MKRHQSSDFDGTKLFDIWLQAKIAENCSQNSFEVISDEPFVSDFVPSLAHSRRWIKEDRELTIWEEEEEWDDDEEEEWDDE